MKPPQPNWLQAKKPWQPTGDALKHARKAILEMGLPSEGVTYLLHCFKTGEGRKVQSGFGNVTSKYVSTKFGHQVSLESRRGESVYATMLDEDDDVIYWMTQPNTIYVDSRKSAEGRTSTTLPYTGDFLLLKRNGAFVVEVKDLAAIARKAAVNPYQYYKAEDQGDGIEKRNWHYRAAEEAFAKLGIGHRVISDDALPKVAVQNWRFLEPFTQVDCPPLEEQRAAQLIERVQHDRVIDHQALLSSGFTADEIFKAVVAKIVYVDLTRQRLHDSSELKIYADRTTYDFHREERIAKFEPPMPVPAQLTYRTGTVLYISGQKRTVVVGNQRQVVVCDEESVETTYPIEALRLLVEQNLVTVEDNGPRPRMRQFHQYSSAEIEKAIEKLNAVKDPSKSRWGKTQLNEFKKIIAPFSDRQDQIVALVDKTRNKGNRTKRLSETSLKLAKTAIDLIFNQPDVSTKRAAHNELVRLGSGATDENGAPLRICSYEYFTTLCNQDVDLSLRLGHKRSYKLSPIISPLDNELPVHGTRPFEILHCDHTVLTLATVSPNGVSLGKPLLTVLRDAHTVRTVAFVLTYFDPSAMVVLFVLRDLVRRCGRLPRVIVVDNGSEFRSQEFLHFCRIYDIEVRYRPRSKPRSGAPVERSFLGVQEEVVRQMKGNTLPLMNAREIGKDINPFDRAEWTLKAAHGALEKYWFVVKNNEVSRTLGMSPNEYEKLRMEQTGGLEHTIIPYDEDVILLTCPHPHRRLHVIDPVKGVWVDDLYYQHPSFKHAPKKNKVKVEVRVEPWMHRVVYAFHGGQWITAVASNARWLGDKTQREVEIAIRKERKVAMNLAQKKTVKRRKAEAERGDFSPKEFDARLRIQCDEMKHLFDDLGMTASGRVDGESARGQSEFVEKQEHAEALGAPPRQCNPVDDRGDEDATDSQIEASLPVMEQPQVDVPDNELSNVLSSSMHPTPNLADSVIVDSGASATPTKLKTHGLFGFRTGAR